MDIQRNYSNSLILEFLQQFLPLSKHLPHFGCNLHHPHESVKLQRHHLLRLEFLCLLFQTV
jgi:hypothetical protein